MGINIHSDIIYDILYIVRLKYIMYVRCILQKKLTQFSSYFMILNIALYISVVNSI